MASGRSARRRAAGDSPAKKGSIPPWLIWSGLALVAIVLVSIFAVQSGDNESSVSDFRMVAYQGGDVIGEEANFADLVGHGQPVVLNFWAGLCPPCRQEMPGFQKVYDEMGDQFILIGVDIGPFVGLGSHADAEQFLADFEITYPTAFATTSSPIQDYRVLGMPTTVFITADGQIDDTYSGFLTEADMRRRIQALIDQAS
jgi:thiol-disulfide isomerase/thioredoxin